MNILIVALFAAVGAFASPSDCRYSLTLESLARANGTLISDHDDLALLDKDKPYQRANVPGLGPGTVTLSPAGASFWEDAETFASWLESLDTLTSEERSCDLIHAIGRSGPKRGPGLSPELCQRLHETYEVLDREFPDFDGNLEYSDRERWLQKQLQLAEEGVLPTDGILFPWQPHIGHGGAYMHGSKALLLARLLARESLANHLVTKDYDGSWILGHQLTPESRLAMAIRPSLIGVMPLLKLRPARISTTEGIGSEEGQIWLISQMFRSPETNCSSLFRVTLDFAAPTYHGMKAYFQLAQRPPSQAGEIPPEVDHLRKFVREALARYRQMAGLTHELIVVLNEEKVGSRASGPIGVRLHFAFAGMGRRNRLLFFYFLAEALKSNDGWST